MPTMAERKNIMVLERQPTIKPPCKNNDYIPNAITLNEFIEIALYTVQKINNYPKSFGKTIENYFHLLFPDEIKAYLIRQATNRMSFKKFDIKHNLYRRRVY